VPISDCDIYADYGKSIYNNAESTNTTINYDNNSLSSRYFETNVTTNSILIVITSTITANQQKTLSELYIGSEIGTFIADLTSLPNAYTPTVINNNPIMLRKSNLGTKRINRGNKYSATFRIRELWETADRTLMQNMYMTGSFVIYPCGGYRWYDDIGFRVEDLYHVVWDGEFSNAFSVGRVKTLGVDISFDLLEQ
jgi:hypothetical protein